MANFGLHIRIARGRLGQTMENFLIYQVRDDAYSVDFNVIR